MAKQEKNRFQLNKGTEHGFDISKGGKRKFDLSKDDDEAVVANVNTENTTNQKSKQTGKPASTASNVPEPNQEQKKGHKGLLWIVVIIVVALLAWWLWPSSSDDVIKQDEQIEEPSGAVSDSITSDSAVTVENPESTATDKGVVMPSDEAVPAPSTPIVETSSSAPGSAGSSNASPTAVNVSNDIESEARKVIRGDYGVGQERKNKLGNKYESIQSRVNELKREGIF